MGLAIAAFVAGMVTAVLALIAIAASAYKDWLK